VKYQFSLTPPELLSIIFEQVQAQNQKLWLEDQKTEVLPLWIQIAVAVLPVKEDELPTGGAAEIMKTNTTMTMTRIMTRMRDNMFQTDIAAKIGMKDITMMMSMKTLDMEKMMMTMKMTKTTGKEEGPHRVVGVIQVGKAITPDEDLAA
jgi:hypothetical protein